MKALRMSEEEYAQALKRSGRVALPVLAKAAATEHKNASPATHKFHVKQRDGYASGLEARRANELRLLERAGAICELREQVRFVVIDAQRDTAGMLIERECAYVADFTYNERGKSVVEDCKGYTRGTAYALYAIKRKLMLLRYGVRIREVTRQASSDSHPKPKRPRESARP